MFYIHWIPIITLLNEYYYCQLADSEIEDSRIQRNFTVYILIQGVDLGY